jgi:acetyl esterase/lipase
MTDAKGLPKAYIEVGELDLFRDDDIRYLQKLLAAGVPCEFHLRPGCPHAFEVYAPKSNIAQRAIADRIRAVQLD